MSETKKRKICIIDDEAAIREIYQTALEQTGYAVVTAADGAEGLQVIRTEKPDAALIDVMMPNVDGMELIEEIRADKEIANLPIVVMTNIDDQKIMKRAGKLEVKFYLVKSLFEPKKVVAIVNEVMHNV